MPKEKIIDKVSFTYSGLLNFEEIYKSIKNFWDSKGFNFIEKKHEEKVNEDGSRDIKLEWSCEKEVTDYVKYLYEFEINVKGLKKVIVKDEGVEKEMDYANEFSVELNGELETDYGKLFEGKPFHMFLRAMYEKYLVKPEIKEHKKKLSQIGDEFLDMLKVLTASYPKPK